MLDEYKFIKKEHYHNIMDTIAKYRKNEITADEVWNIFGKFLLCLCTRFCTRSVKRELFAEDILGYSWQGLTYCLLNFKGETVKHFLAYLTQKCSFTIIDEIRKSDKQSRNNRLEMLKINKHIKKLRSISGDYTSSDETIVDMSPYEKITITKMHKNNIRKRSCHSSICEVNKLVETDRAYIVPITSDEPTAEIKEFWDIIRSNIYSILKKNSKSISPEQLSINTQGVIGYLRDGLTMMEAGHAIGMSEASVCINWMKARKELYLMVGLKQELYDILPG